jgi:hypothetical protein
VCEIPGGGFLRADHAGRRWSDSVADSGGITAQYTSEFVLDLARPGAAARTRRDRLFEVFVANQRPTNEFIEALLHRG